jgi:integrating conjugative element protein (TIGR03761 family)
MDALSNPSAVQPVDAPTPAPARSHPLPAGREHPAGDTARPGVLRGEASIVLHTRHGQQLYLGRQASTAADGRPVRSIPGVLRFASQVRQAAIGARAGDPYADWMLVRLDQELDTVEAAYADFQATVDRQLRNCTGINIQVALSVQPLTVSLSFGSPYAFKAAEIVAGFDALACGILTAIHTARTTRGEGELLLKNAKRHARRFLATPSRYAFSGATREDLVHNTQRGAAAVARFGALPEEILHRHVRPRFERVEGATAAPATAIGSLDDDVLDGDDEPAITAD